MTNAEWATRRRVRIGEIVRLRVAEADGDLDELFPDDEELGRAFLFTRLWKSVLRKDSIIEQATDDIRKLEEQEESDAMGDTR